MTSKTKLFGIAVALIAIPALVAALPVAPLQEEHHSGATTQDQEEAMAASTEGEASCPMAGQMMTMMQRHMGMMQQMMGHMRGGDMMGAGMHGMKPGMMGAGMHGMKPGMMGAGMHGMMCAFDPADIEDPEKADKMAEMLRSRAEQMRAHLQKIDERASALEARAEELRTQSEDGS